MSVHELKALLDQVSDTRELVLRREPAWNALYDVWSDAHVDAEDAYRRWARSRDVQDYAAYRAAQDREDAAQDALAEGSP
jgi:hypothetical protein